jgi:hypothetical protein
VPSWGNCARLCPEPKPLTSQRESAPSKHKHHQPACLRSATATLSTQHSHVRIHTHSSNHTAKHTSLHTATMAAAAVPGTLPSCPISHLSPPYSPPAHSLARVCEEAQASKRCSCFTPADPARPTITPHSIKLPNTPPHHSLRASAHRLHCTTTDIS